VGGGLFLELVGMVNERLMEPGRCVLFHSMYDDSNGLSDNTTDVVY